MDSKQKSPTLTEIMDAIRNGTLQKNIGDIGLTGYTCCENNNPETNWLFPFMTYSGGCCVTVPLQEHGAPKKCLRIWHKDMPEIEKRSSIVCKGLKASKLKYFLDYQYVNSIKIGDKDCPGILMDWGDYPTLAEFLKERKPTSDKIKKVKENFYTLCLNLSNAGIAHGDLSSSNILVKEDLNLLLIDYDSMYVPEMGNRYKQNILGTDGYQHRERNCDLIAAKDNDNFSQQVIYLCLLAFEKKTELLETIKDKNLLFVKKDFENSDNFIDSLGFKLIAELGNKVSDFYLEQLGTAISGSLREVRSIVQIEMPVELTKPSIVFAPFCGTCGHHFDAPTDRFCPDCGKPRETVVL